MNLDGMNKEDNLHRALYICAAVNLRHSKELALSWARSVMPRPPTLLRTSLQFKGAADLLPAQELDLCWPGFLIPGLQLLRSSLRRRHPRVRLDFE